LLSGFAWSAPPDGFRQVGDSPMRQGKLILGRDVSAALQKLASSLTISSSAILLAAYTLAASESLGLERLVLHLHSANRLDPLRMKSVTRLKSMSMVPFQRVSDRFTEVARSIYASVLVGYRHAQFPPGLTRSLLESPGLDCRAGFPFFLEFNDRRVIRDSLDSKRLLVPSPPSVGKASELPEGRVTITESHRTRLDPYLWLAVDGRSSGELVLTLDTNVFTDDQIVRTIGGLVENMKRAL
jgi:hypothetical protein